PILQKQDVPQIGKINLNFEANF
ncbi:MAG: hypothetical protein UV61_C0004G0001, partial [Candidatus Gottesmanbacteria bacterium GW2011_GWB1_43_11]